MFFLIKNTCLFLHLLPFFVQQRFNQIKHLYGIVFFLVYCMLQVLTVQYYILLCTTATYHGGTHHKYTYIQYVLTATST